MIQGYIVKSWLEWRRWRRDVWGNAIGPTEQQIATCNQRQHGHWCIKHDIDCLTFSRFFRNFAIWKSYLFDLWVILLKNGRHFVNGNDDPRVYHRWRKSITAVAPVDRSIRVITALVVGSRQGLGATRSRTPCCYSLMSGAWAIVACSARWATWFCVRDT